MCPRARRRTMRSAPLAWRGNRASGAQLCGSASGRLTSPACPHGCCGPRPELERLAVAACTVAEVRPRPLDHQRAGLLRVVPARWRAALAVVEEASDPLVPPALELQ